MKYYFEKYNAGVLEKSQEWELESAEAALEYAKENGFTDFHEIGDVFVVDEVDFSAIIHWEERISDEDRLSKYNTVNLISSDRRVKIIYVQITDREVEWFRAFGWQVELLIARIDE